MTTTSLRPARVPAAKTFALLAASLLTALMLTNPLPTPSSLSGADAPAGLRGPAVSQSLSSLPLTFLPNAGQADPQVSFYLQGAGGSVWFTPTGVTMA
ncbi:MAG TPA: hypothetical protein VHL54_11930, partial [Actinomycetota bacterium]|nr:hypothetical protein [Actinomycetota bacterium]